MTASPDPPAAPPFASSPKRPQPRKSAALRPIGAGNTPRETRTRSASERTSRPALDELAANLSERDWAVLRSIAAHRFLTTKQVETLHFSTHASPATSARTCRQVMKRLERDKVVRSLQRRVGGIRAGSASYVWTTGAVGRRLLALDSPAYRRRHAEPSERFMRHALAIADVHLQLRAGHQRHAIELLSLELEPDCWRPFTAAGGQRSVLQPDLAVTTGAGEYEDAWFIEVDLGTEHIPTLVRKCQQYETYRRSGIEQDRHGSFPWVIWLLSTNERIERFQAAIERARDLDTELFRLATPDGLLAIITNNNAPKGGEHA